MIISIIPALFHYNSAEYEREIKETIKKTYDLLNAETRPKKILK